MFVRSKRNFKTGERGYGSFHFNKVYKVKDDDGKLFIQHGWVEEVEAPKKKEKTKKVHTR